MGIPAGYLIMCFHYQKLLLVRLLFAIHQVTIGGLALSRTRYVTTQEGTSMLAVLQIECSSTHAGLVDAVRMKRKLLLGVRWSIKN